LPLLVKLHEIWSFVDSHENHDIFATNCQILRVTQKFSKAKKTSALAMHLPLARLISMPVIFCLLPSSSIVILVFYLFLFSTGISEH